MTPSIYTTSTWTPADPYKKAAKRTTPSVTQIPNTGKILLPSHSPVLLFNPAYAPLAAPVALGALILLTTLSTALPESLLVPVTTALPALFTTAGKFQNGTLDGIKLLMLEGMN
jgi:hypothetical protein